MKMQEAFNTVVAGIRKQGYQVSARVESATSQCMYRLDRDNGPALKCAAGQLIPARLYRKHFEGKNIEYIMDHSPALNTRFERISYMVNLLQKLHDRIASVVLFPNVYVPSDSKTQVLFASNMDNGFLFKMKSGEPADVRELFEQGFSIVAFRFGLKYTPPQEQPA